MLGGDLRRTRPEGRGQVATLKGDFGRKATFWFSPASCSGLSAGLLGLRPGCSNSSGHRRVDWGAAPAPAVLSFGISLIWPNKVDHVLDKCYKPPSNSSQKAGRAPSDRGWLSVVCRPPRHRDGAQNETGAHGHR